MKIKRIQILIPILLGMMACTEPLKVEPYAYPVILSGETTKTWKIDYLQYVEEGKGTQTFGLTECVFDDLYTFHKTGRLYEVSNGANKCAEDEPDLLVSNTWSLVSATATLNLILPIFSDNSLPFVVRTMKEKEMMLEFFLDENNTSSYRIHFELISEE